MEKDDDVKSSNIQLGGSKYIIDTELDKLEKRRLILQNKIIRLEKKLRK